MSTSSCPFTPPHGSPAFERGEEGESEKGGSPKPPPTLCFAKRSSGGGAGFTIGREPELNGLLAFWKRGVPILITGKSGLGKTHLLQQFLTLLRKHKATPIYLERLWPFKPALLTLYAALSAQPLSEPESKRLKRLTIPELTQETLTLLEQVAATGKPVVLLDRLEDAPIAAADFLTKLSSLALVYGAAQYVKRTRVLRRFFWHFELLELSPLATSDARLLAERLAQERTLKLQDPAFFFNQVITQSGGVPLAIVETIARVPADQPVSRTQIRELFIHGSGVKWVDATPLIILVFCLFIALRFIARGFSDFQAYALFGALGGIGLFIRYLIFRQYARKRG